MPRIVLEQSVEDRDELRHATSSEVFDRMAFAERALAMVRPARTRIALCEGARGVSVRSGRRWGRGPGARWAILTVPPDASRQAIALAVLELGVRGGEPAPPFAIDALVRGATA